MSKSISYQCNRLFNIQVIQFKVTKSIGSFLRNHQNTRSIVKHTSDMSCNWFNLWWESRFLGWLTFTSSVSVTFKGFFGWNSIDAGSLSVNVRNKMSNWFERKEEISCRYYREWILLICSSDGFTNILTLRIYKIECCYLHSQYIRINNKNKQTKFHKKHS